VEKLETHAELGENLKERYYLEGRRKYENNIEIDLKQIGREEVDWIHQAQNSDQLQAQVNMH
jgi:hypothetical protein